MQADRIHFRSVDPDQWFTTPLISEYSGSLLASRTVYLDSQPVGETFQGVTTAEVRLEGSLGPYGYATIRGVTSSGTILLFVQNGNGISVAPYDSGVIQVPPEVTAIFCEAQSGGTGTAHAQLRFRVRPNP